MLAAIARDGRTAVERYARDLAGWRGPVVLGEDDFAKASRSLSPGVKDDIAFARARVRDFAQRQRDSLREFETELIPGLVAGQKLIPLQTAGCYVPGGRYAHAASAIMSVCTAKVAGVPNIVATSPGHEEAGVHPAILHTMKLCGADTVLALGGVPAIAALAYVLYAPRPADVIVGPGNRFVAEAKRMLSGRVGINVVAGPTESAIIADVVGDNYLDTAVRIVDADHRRQRRSRHRCCRFGRAGRARTRLACLVFHYLAGCGAYRGRQDAGPDCILARTGAPRCRRGLARLRGGGARFQPRRGL